MKSASQLFAVLTLVCVGNMSIVAAQPPDRGPGGEPGAGPGGTRGGPPGGFRGFGGNMPETF